MMDKRYRKAAPPIVQRLSVDDGVLALLPGSDFSDNHGFIVTGRRVEAPAVAMALFQNVPAWTAGLMRLRNRVVEALGLKTVALGAFPVLCESPELVILGLDDRHLDFRIVIRVGECQRVNVSTLVRIHNRLGRAYLAAVLPFHRIIVAESLKRTAAELAVLRGSH